MNNISFIDRRSIRAAVFLLGLLVATTGCEKPEEELGVQVQPSGDLLNVSVIDTATLITYSEAVDSLRSDELSQNLLGSYVDPVFGKSEASIVTQILPSGFVDTFYDPNFVVIDSMVLGLAYTGDFYGNLTAQTFRVYRITEDLSVDSAYYSNDVFTFDATDLVLASHSTQAPDPDEVTVVGSDTLPVSQMRFHLNTTLGDEFINQAWTTSDFLSSSAFFNYFKGLIIVPDNPGQATDEGGIVNFDLLSDYTTLQMYYHITEPGAEDTLSFEFNVSDDCARANQFVHDYSGTAVESQFNDPTLGQQEVYVQAMSGVRTKIEIPHLFNFIDSGLIAINKAEIVVEIDENQIDAYLPNDRIFLIGVDTAGLEYIILDQLEGDSHVNGFYDGDAQQFRVNITRHVQNLFTLGLTGHSLYLISGEGSVSANRSVLFGPENTTKSIKLELTYTQY